jgi:hypothetical protein
MNAEIFLHLNAESAFNFEIGHTALKKLVVLHY